VREERLKYVADVRVSNVDKTTVDGDCQVRLCNYTDVYYNEQITRSIDFMAATATHEQRAVFGLKSGDVVVTKDSETADDIGVSAAVAEDIPDLVCGYHLAIVRARAGSAVGGYLRWVLAATLARQRMSAAATGVTRFGLRSDAIADLPVQVPPVATQRAIADYLDRETARIDAVIAAKRRMVELLESEFRSKQVAILTGDSHVSRQSHPVLGSLPSHWSSRRAKFCTAGITVGVVVNPSSYFVDEGIPFIHGTDVREGSIDTAHLRMLSAQSNAILAKSQLRAGDVVAMRVGYPGRASVVPCELDGANCASVLIFRRSPELRPELICEFLNSPLGRAQIEAVQYGAAQEVMNVSDAVNLCLPFPPAAEQTTLVTKLAVARARWQEVCALLDRQMTCLQERRQALVTAVVTEQFNIPEAA
jgi:type I restriction enzyme S subunit